MEKIKLVLIEDNEDSALFIQQFFQEGDYEIDVFTTVTDSISNILFNKYDLIILDLNLPDYHGFEVLQFINKQQIHIPVIVASAYSDKNIKLRAFKLGASDYMVKPIDLDELEARIWIHIGRNTQLNFSPNIEIFKIDSNLIYFNGEQLHLTQIEKDILQTLIKNKNNTISREDLANSLSKQSSQRTLDYHIKNIRKKIAQLDPNKDYIFTEYGIGYKLIF